MSPRSSTPAVQAAAVLERLLIDPAFRAGFRAAPAATLERHGMTEVARRLRGDGRGLQTLELRESRSSLAGVLIAAAVEGVALFDAVAQQSRPLDDEAAEAMRQALARPAVRQLTAALPAVAPGPAAESAAAAGAGAPSNPAAAMPAVPAVPGAPAVPGVPAVPPGAPAAPAPSARTGLGAAARLDAPPDPEPAARGDAPPDAGTDASADAGDVVPYPGDAAPRAAIAAWMGAAAERAGLPPELPVMAALQESSLRNLAGGDADSAGYFQMRVGLWDQGPYRGYRDRPELQLRWFIEHALHEKAAHWKLAGSPERYGEWIADVERPLAANRGLYAQHLTEARRLLGAGQEHAQASASASAAADGVYADHPRAVSRRLLRIAARELGEREDPPGSNDSARIAQYRDAGPDAGVGPWCAYFVSWATRSAGVALGEGEQGFASVDALWAWAQQSGHAVAAGRSPRPGDLVVWDEHVGIVERVDPDGTLHTIEGNTSDQVARRVHGPAGVVGFVRLT